MLVGIIIFFIAILLIGFINSIPEYGAASLIAVILLVVGLYSFLSEAIKFSNKSSLKKTESSSEDNYCSEEEYKNEVYNFEDNKNFDGEAEDNKKELIIAKEYIFPTNDLLNYQEEANDFI